MAFQGKRVSKSVEQEVVGLPNKTQQSRHPFYLMVHPRHGWSWDSVNRKWIPEVSRLAISPGIAGTPEPTKLGEVNSDFAMLTYQKKGFKILMDKDEYLYKWPRAGGGSFYTTIWDTVEDLYGRPEWFFDADGFNEYLDSKLQDGTIPPMHPMLKKQKIADEMKRLERLELRLNEHKTNAAVSRYEKLKANVEAMQKDLEESKNDGKTVSKRRD